MKLWIFIYCEFCEFSLIVKFIVNIHNKWNVNVKSGMVLKWN